MIIGMMTILQSGYNPYNDLLVIPMLLINQAVIWMVERLSLWLRKKFKVWEPRGSAEKKARKNRVGNSGETDQSIIQGENHQPQEIMLQSLRMGNKKVEGKSTILGSRPNSTLINKKKTEKFQKRATPKYLDVYDKYKE